MADINMNHEEKTAAVPAENDPWEVGEFKIDSVKWRDLSTGGKVKRVLWDYICKPILLIAILYLFICSLTLLSSAFRLLGGKAAGKAISDASLLQNPVAGLMIGVLVTVLVQSSSTSTSIVITMVGAGGLLGVRQAVYIIMGANIGTTVTNTIVAMGQAGRKDEYRRAFGAATVHDMFNWLSVLIILPIEAASGYLYHLTKLIVDSFHLERQNVDQEYLTAITKPFTSLIVQIDKKVITNVATGTEGAEDAQVLKIWCNPKTSTNDSDIAINATTVSSLLSTVPSLTDLITNATEAPGIRCKALFSQWDLSDVVAGIILLLLALVWLCLCLLAIVKLLHSMLKGQVAIAVRKILNANFPGCLSWLTGYVAMLAGAGITVILQSSSVFTSALTPLVGIGLITIERMYPLTLGSNIGTTATGILAAFSAEGTEQLRNSVQLSLCHLFFNISGILLWYPLPFMRKVPITLAKMLGDTTAEYRWFGFFYLVMMFLILPAVVFGLSVAGWYVLLGIGGPILLLFFIVVIINVIQRKRPGCLPAKLRNWDWLPLWMHSLDPMENGIRRVFGCCPCCKKLLARPEDESHTDIEAPSNDTRANQVDGKANPAFSTEDLLDDEGNTRL